MNTYIVETKRLALVELALEQAPALFNIWSNENVAKYMNITPFATLTDTEEMLSFMLSLITEGKATRYAIIEKDSAEIIGTCGINTLEDANKVYELGYELAYDAWNKGYATEILLAYIEHAKAIHQATAFDAWVIDKNSSSIKLLEKLGFKEQKVKSKLDENGETLLYFSQSI